ncbi:hypothetical protein [Actinophytocola sp. NPDC049390]|uniref:hypothetical protein n=1 Tax=Actinophytocola sp. NPDC049390 TaxID=3363894 RepID=UPI0037AE7841
MRALTVFPGRVGSLAVIDVAQPGPERGELPVEGIAVGVRGTNEETVRVEDSWAPPGRERLAPCGACAHGELDMCRNGRYAQRGIEEIDGYGRELWCVGPDHAVTIDPRLTEAGTRMEPATVVVKAWEQITGRDVPPRFRRRPRGTPRTRVGDRSGRCGAGRVRRDGTHRFLRHRLELDDAGCDDSRTEGEECQA